jgi:FKBP-type peptidyl-prolyl cis-trans isomerase
MEPLRDKFLNVPVDAVLHPASDSAQQVAQEQKDKALNVRVDAVLHSASDSAQQIAKEQNDKARTMVLEEKQSYGGQTTAAGLIIKVTKYIFLILLIAMSFCVHLCVSRLVPRLSANVVAHAP